LLQFFDLSHWVPAFAGTNGYLNAQFQQNRR
jgi:hypothetical protein